MEFDESSVVHSYADLGEVRLHYVEAGDGPLVILLHGFPEFWYSWHHQIPALVAAGYRVVAPDMRGYNLSSKPKGVKAYRLENLATDVAQLIDHCGEERAVVVGHDWGGAVAWMFAMMFPEKLDRLAILNMPHLHRFLMGLKTFRQLRKSWYIGFFQIPILAESAFRSRNFASIRKTFRTDPVRPGAFSEDDIQRYIDALRRQGALKATINYYRAAARRNPKELVSKMSPIDQPVLVIWGEKDRYLGLELAEPDSRWVRDLTMTIIPDASHWVQVDQPQLVNDSLLDFLALKAAL
mgnify:CR=1 FL=1